MGRLCNVKLCQSNESIRKKEHVNLFSIPKNPILNERWTSIVNTWNCNNDRVNYLCHKHFVDEDINKTFVGQNSEDNQTWKNRSKFTLKYGTIPKIFNTLNVPKCRNALKWPEEKCGKEIENDHENNDKNISSTPQNFNKIITSFHDLINLYENINIPKNWTSLMDTNFISFCCLKPNVVKNKMVIEKQVVFNKNLDISFYINDTLLNIDEHDCTLCFSKMTKYDLEDVLLHLDKKEMCIGGPVSTNYPGIEIKYGVIRNDIWHHLNCTVLVKTKKLRCEWCDRLCGIFRAETTS